MKTYLGTFPTWEVTNQNVNYTSNYINYWTTGQQRELFHVNYCYQNMKKPEWCGQTQWV